MRDLICDVITCLKLRYR